MDPTSQPSATAEFPCPQCGAKLTFAPGTGGMACPYCGYTEAIQPTTTGSIVEHDLRAGIQHARRLRADQMVQGGREVQCQGCGARAIVTQLADHCAFCGSPRVTPLERQDEVLAPESLLPFAIDPRRATEAFRRWVASRWFAPNDLAKRARTQGMDGAYLPFWTYDSQTTTRYTGMRGEYYWVNETYRDEHGRTQTRRVRKTRWFPAAGVVRVEFDDVLVCATKTLPAKLVQDLEPWDLTALHPYQPHYLSGFTAERYTIPLEEGFKIAEQRMVPEIREAIARDIGGDTQQILDFSVSHADTKFKHLLLPLWISSFRYGEKVFRVVVNARTGQVAGERPWSAIKIALLVLSIALVLTLGILAYVNLR